jgi:hypothetical protein
LRKEYIKHGAEPSRSRDARSHATFKRNSSRV